MVDQKTDVESQVMTVEVSFLQQKKIESATSQLHCTGLKGFAGVKFKVASSRFALPKVLCLFSLK